jgi:hypothetical protein
MESLSTLERRSLFTLTDKEWVDGLRQMMAHKEANSKKSSLHSEREKRGREIGVTKPITTPVCCYGFAGTEGKFLVLKSAAERQHKKPSSGSGKKRGGKRAAASKNWLEESLDFQFVKPLTTAWGDTYVLPLDERVENAVREVENSVLFLPSMDSMETRTVYKRSKGKHRPEALSMEEQLDCFDTVTVVSSLVDDANAKGHGWKTFIDLMDAVTWGEFLADDATSSEKVRLFNIPWGETKWFKGRGYYTLGAFVANLWEMLIWNRYQESTRKGGTSCHGVEIPSCLRAQKLVQQQWEQSASACMRTGDFQVAFLV